MKKLTQSELKQQVHYDPESGLFTRLISNIHCVKVGSIAGGLHKSTGYIHLRVNNKRYLAHRLAFLYMEGYFPEHQIDHKDGVRANNKWFNLRHATPLCNFQNQKISKNNTSGFPGVSWRKDYHKWQCSIKMNGKYIHLGWHDDPLEAALVRFTFEVWCSLWTCNYRSELVKSIKSVWPEFVNYLQRDY